VPVVRSAERLSLAEITQARAAVVRDGEVVVRPMMTVTLIVDHRAVDGAPAAEFLKTVKALLEDPALAL